LEGRLMAIDNELTSEIAAALLTGKTREPHELRHLKETIIRVHTMLQELSAESRKNRLLLSSTNEEEGSRSRRQQS
jgi:hypothetical protein